jgi:hypothetical protein
MVRSQLEDSTAQPYVRENLAALSLMFDAQIIAMTPEGIEVTASSETLRTWFKLVHAFVNCSIIDSYRDGNIQELEQAAQTYCSTDPALNPKVAKLIAWVNRSR